MSSEPWESEPDAIDWVDEATGLACAVRRGGVGALCGYVGVPPGHPLFGLSYDDLVPLAPEDGEAEIGRDVGAIDALVSALGGEHERGVTRVGMTLHAHGGLTFSGPDLGGEAPAGLWWFGFDC